VFTVRDVRQYGNTKLNIYQVLRLSVASVTAAAGILVPASEPNIAKAETCIACRQDARCRIQGGATLQKPRSQAGRSP
jgi:hypothetical protein